MSSNAIGGGGGGVCVSTSNTNTPLTPLKGGIRSPRVLLMKNKQKIRVY